MTVNYVAPKLKGPAFHCNQCGTFAKQSWHDIYWLLKNYTPDNDMVLSKCDYCGKRTYWYVPTERIVFPPAISAPIANEDLPVSVQGDFEEAREILERSPRGASALLRLALQKLLKELGESGKDINADIAALMKRGLPPPIQQALDVVRVIGNNSVHPGQIDMTDNRETALSLFTLINMIVTHMISNPKHVQTLYAELPEGVLEQIEKRDKPEPS